MHEAGLISSAVTALSEASPVGVASAVIGFGPGVDPDAAAAAWQVAVIGTPVAEADVDWEPVLDILACLECRRHYAGTRLDRCPHCGGDGLVIERAAEITVLDWNPADSGGGRPRPAGEVESR